MSDIHYDIRDHFRRHDLDQFVDAYVLSFEHGIQKPDAEMFTLALDALGVSADRALMVGDTPANDGARDEGRDPDVSAAGPVPSRAAAARAASTRCCASPGYRRASRRRARRSRLPTGRGAASR